MRKSIALLTGILLYAQLGCPTVGRLGDPCDEAAVCGDGLECLDGLCRNPPSGDPDAGPGDSGAQDAAGGQDGATGQDTAGGTDTSSRPDTAGTDAGPTSACDDRVTFTPNPPQEGEALAIAYTDESGITNVHLYVEAVGAPSVAFVEWTGNPPTWHFAVAGHAAGPMTLTFTLDQGAGTYTCVTEVQPGTATDAGPGDTATPEDAGPPEDAGQMDTATAEDAAAPEDSGADEDAS